MKKRYSNKEKMDLVRDIARAESAEDLFRKWGIPLHETQVHNWLKKSGLKAGKTDYKEEEGEKLLKKLNDMETKIAILDDLFKEEKKEAKKLKKRPAKK